MRWVLRNAAFVAVLVLGVLALRIVLVNAFEFANWADAESYAGGSAPGLRGRDDVAFLLVALAVSVPRPDQKGRADRLRLSAGAS